MHYSNLTPDQKEFLRAAKRVGMEYVTLVIVEPGRYIVVGVSMVLGLHDVRTRRIDDIGGFVDEK